MGIFKSCGIREERQGLLLAMAMIETTLLVAKQADHSKDNFADKSANTSIFNLNEDMLRELGYKSYEADYKKVIDELNQDGALPTVVRLLNQAFDKWTVLKTLHWVRGGRTTFKDGKSYDAPSYVKAVATSLRLMDEDSRLLFDDRRVQMNVAYQTHDPKSHAAGNSAVAKH